MTFSDLRPFLRLLSAACALAPGAAFAQSICAPLPAPTAAVIELSPAQAASLPAVVMSAQPGTTIQLTDGTYVLPQTLAVSRPGITIRSKSGNRSAVTLDGMYAVGDLVLVMESNITIADITLTRAYNHAVHVSPEQHTTSGTLIHNVRVVDSAEQFIKINANNGFYPDNGVVRCSSLEMTDAGRAQVRNNCYTGGIDGHQAQGWQIYLNAFSGFWCSSGLSEHAIHFWKGSRDTLIDRNVIVNSARGAGLGLGESWPEFRIYADQPCGGAIGLGHYGGAITNTIIFANDPRLFASSSGFDSGITLEQSCATSVVHNTVFSTSPPFSSIEFRWPHTLAIVANNIVSHNIRPRDGAVATLAGNLTNAPASLFVDAVAAGDLHLKATATAAIGQAAVLSAPVLWDIDSAARDSSPDIGADEFVGAAPPVAPRRNVAAATNGATAVASSSYSASYPAGGVLDGNRRGGPWGGGTGWNDATPNARPDWIEVRFAGVQSIEEVDVFSLQDDYWAPVEPALGQTFSLYGVTDFQVEYWTGTQWALVPGGSVAGNRQVWRQILFAPVTTTAIRITVTGTIDLWTRVTEVEAYTATTASTVSVPDTVGLTQAGATTVVTKASLVVGTVTTVSTATVPAGSVISQTPAGGTIAAVGSAVNLTVSKGPAPTRRNVAAAANGGTATASSSYSADYPAGGVLDGNRRGGPWGGGTGWNDATPNARPDWIEVRFAGAESIEEVDVFSLQDNYGAPVEPTLGQTFSLYGVTDFQLEYWTGTQWALVPGGSVAGNRQVWRQILFAPVTTTAIRITVTGTIDLWTRLTEVEAYTATTSTTASGAALLQ